jgi:hypothetical protein
LGINFAVPFYPRAVSNGAGVKASGTSIAASIKKAMLAGLAKALALKVLAATRAKLPIIRCSGVKKKYWKIHDESAA